MIFRMIPFCHFPVNNFGSSNGTHTIRLKMAKRSSPDHFMTFLFFSLFHRLRSLELVQPVHFHKACEIKKKGEFNAVELLFGSQLSRCWLCHNVNEPCKLLSVWVFYRRLKLILHRPLF